MDTPRHFSLPREKQKLSASASVFACLINPRLVGGGKEGDRQVGTKSHLLLPVGQEVCNLLTDGAGQWWQLVMERGRDSCVKDRCGCVLSGG